METDNSEYKGQEGAKFVPPEKKMVNKVKKLCDYIYVRGIYSKSAIQKC